jgi:hypothetical protein
MAPKRRENCLRFILASEANSEFLYFYQKKEKCLPLNVLPVHTPVSESQYEGSDVGTEDDDDAVDDDDGGEEPEEEQPEPDEDVDLLVHCAGAS